MTCNNLKPFYLIGIISLLFIPARFQLQGNTYLENFEIIIPLVIGDANTATGIAVSNLGDSSAEVKFTIYSQDGNPIWEPVYWDHEHLNEGLGQILPGEQRALHVFEIFQIDPKTEHTGWMQIETSSPDIRVLYQYISSRADQLDGMNGISSLQKKLLFPWIYQGQDAYYGNPAETRISVLNPGESEAEISIALIDESGQTAGSTLRTLDGKAMLFLSVAELFSEIENFSGYVVVEGNSSIAGCELISIQGSGSNAFVVSNPLDTDHGATDLYSAQVAKVGGVGTDAKIINLDESTRSFTLRVRGSDGTSLSEPHTIQIPSMGFFAANLGLLFALPEGTIGTLSVESSNPRFTGSVVFGDPARAYAASLPLQAESIGTVVFPHMAHIEPGRNSPGIFTGLAFHAPGSNTLEAEIEILNSKGELQSSGSFTLQPGERTSKLISELVEVQQQAGGYIRIKTNGEPMVAQELFGDTWLQMLSAVPSYSDPGFNPLDIPVSEFILVDQFGYVPDSEKIAVIKDPLTGFDSDFSFQPGSTYALVDGKTGRRVMTASPAPWDNGSEDTSSGDRAWWFDFSGFAEEGEYYIYDVDQQVRSHVFQISDDVYKIVLKQAFRTFFYQRAGFEKKEPFADAGWTDEASHVGPLQDKQCRRYNAKSDSSTERDLHGGWFDAGDYNKYTNWTADYVIQMLRAYEQTPEVFGDDFGIPESGNGISDLLDEAKWGMDWLIRMQNPDGSVLSIVGLAGGSPPSSAKGQSLYGTENTSATLTSSAAFAYGSKVFGSIGTPEMDAYSADLLARARNAWDWADKNPRVIFRNNDSGFGTGGLGAGQQEVDDYGRMTKKLEAAIFLFEVTKESKYRDYVDQNYDEVNMLQWNFVFPFQSNNQEMLLYYSTLEEATASVRDHIRRVYESGMVNGENNFKKFHSEADPYGAYIKDYTWGSNRTKSSKAGMFLNLVTYNFDAKYEEDSFRAAQRYLHYIHGVNPLGIVYLSNMNDYGAEKSVNEFYHSWFTDGSPLWDRVGESAFGPAPGFLTGGPNPSYNWDGCCPNGCGSASNNLKCFVESISPPLDQPDQKSYKDFNTSWPLNSWSVTENSCGYQLAYIRLLAAFIK